MTTITQVMPEEVVVAILHKVGSDTRLVDDERLAAIFDEAAERYPALMGAFAWHPQYHYSKLLQETFQLLDLGGSIVRENAPTKYFRAAPRTAGAYGETKYERLSGDEQRIVDEIANRIREVFAGS